MDLVWLVTLCERSIKVCPWLHEKGQDSDSRGYSEYRGALCSPQIGPTLSKKLGVNSAIQQRILLCFLLVCVQAEFVSQAEEPQGLRVYPQRVGTCFEKEMYYCLRGEVVGNGG